MTTRRPKRERLRAKLASGTWDELAVRDAILEVRLPGTSKLVLLAVVSHRGGDNPRPVVSVRRLASLASINKDTPARIVAALERDGLLRVTRGSERSPACFDLADLPATLARLLSEPEGQSLSEPEGHEPPAQTELPLSPPAAAAVPSDGTGTPESVRTGGTQGTDQGTTEGTYPLRSAPRAPPKQAAPTKKTGSAKKPERKRTDAEVSAHREILDGYTEAVTKKTGATPEIKSREAAAAWRLLDWAKGDGIRAVGVVRSGVDREFGGTTSLVQIANDPNKYLGGARNGRAREARDHDQVSTVLAAAKRHPLGQAATT